MTKIIRVILPPLAKFADLASFPVTGNTKQLYFAIDTGITYEWNGSVYTVTNSNDPNAIPSSEKGAANGVATLDGTGKVPSTQINDSSDTEKGIAELATQTEVNTGTDAIRIVTPDTLEDKTYGTFTGTIITDNSTIKVALQELETAIATAGGDATDMAALVVERTTDLSITGTSTGTANSIAFDTTATENDPSELEHNNTNTDRIDIKTTGLHQIALSLNVINTSTSDEELDVELRVNGTVVKTIPLEITKTSEELFTRMTAVELTAGSYLSFSVFENTGSGDLSLKATTVAYVLKLQGTKGDTGATGSGSNIIVQDEGITQGTVVDTLDFVGNGVVVTESGGTGTVTIDSSWQPNSVPLLAVAASGASLFANAGAGVYYSFAGTTDDSIFFNDTLSKSNSTYDGSDMKMKLFCRISSSGVGGDTVGLLVDYAIVKLGDNTSTTVTNIAQQNVDVSSEIQDEMFEIELGTMTGVLNAEVLMFSLTRNSTGAGADSYSGNFELLGMELIIV